jgi:hypothetical protein
MAHRRSLGCARDDKSKSSASGKFCCWWRDDKSNSRVFREGLLLAEVGGLALPINDGQKGRELLADDGDGYGDGMGRHAGVLVAGLITKKRVQDMLSGLSCQVRMQNKLARVDAELLVRRNL